MAPVALRYGWRTRGRIVVAVGVTFVLGVVAATAGASWVARIAAAVGFVFGVMVVLDAIVFAASWRFTATSLDVPTLLSRRRKVEGDDLQVELLDGAWSRLAVIGPRGVRIERINPLVSGRDLRRWFDEVPEE